MYIAVLANFNARHVGEGGEEGEWGLKVERHLNISMKHCEFMLSVEVAIIMSATHIYKSTSV